MVFERVKELIHNGVDQNKQRQVWADLGAGSGTFTYALSTLLNDQSKIYAVDKDVRLLNQISINPTIELIKWEKDFNEPLHFNEPLNGIMLANSLHYIQDKATLMKYLKSKLTHDGRVIVIEYDITQGNQWVPFPISFLALKFLTLSVGFKNVSKLAEVPSQYHRSMYSALLS
jgi:trans-aconitate methyltransferase